MMRCPDCRRLSVDWVPIHRAYMCLRLDCLWMSQNPPEGETGVEDQTSSQTASQTQAWPQRVRPRPA